MIFLSSIWYALKAIYYFFIDNKIFLYLLVGLILFIGIVVYFKSCRAKDDEPKIDQQEIQKINRENEEYQNNKLANEMKAIDAPLINANAKVKEATANAANVKPHKNVSGKDLDQMAGEYK